MSAIAHRPLLVVSLAVTSVALIGFLWQRRRKEEYKQNCSLLEHPEFVFSDATAREVSVKLESLKRSRLENIEEEEKVPEEDQRPAAAEDLKSSAAERPVYPDSRAADPARNHTKPDSPVGLGNCESEEQCPYGEQQVAKGVVEDSSVIHRPDHQTPSQALCLAVSTAAHHGEVTADPCVIGMQTSNSNMTEKATEGPSGQEQVPDLEAALKDPLCSSPCGILGSPVKSESSESQRSCEAWSDLIEQDEQEAKECPAGDLSEQLLNMDLTRTGRHDSGVASPTEEYPTAKEVSGSAAISGSSLRSGQRKARLNSGEDAGIGGSDHGDNVSDSGQGSDTSLEDTQLLTYHFHIQDYLCGKLIGKSGAHINKLKTVTNCNIILKDLKETKSQQKKIRLKPRDRQFGEGKLNLCIIEGTRTNIDKCLDLIKDKFIQNRELTLEQVNKPENTPLSLYNGSVTLSLAEGIMHDVFVSSVVGGGHIFIQQPAHPTFSALERLDSCMNNTYSQFSCPDLPRPVLVNTICVASSNGGWFRSQVVSYDADTDMCDIKYNDYGGYDTVPASDLKQIRTDFLTLPFQAIECYLANIIPTDDEISCSVLEELVSNQVVQARMIGMNEEGVPMVHLYRANNGQTVMINRELVDRHAAQWIEATIVPLVPPSQADPLDWNDSEYSSLGSGWSIAQIKLFENLPQFPGLEYGYY